MPCHHRHVGVFLLPRTACRSKRAIMPPGRLQTCMLMRLKRCLSDWERRGRRCDRGASAALTTAALLPPLAPPSLLPPLPPAHRVHMRRLPCWLARNAEAGRRVKGETLTPACVARAGAPRQRTNASCFRHVIVPEISGNIAMFRETYQVPDLGVT